MPPKPGVHAESALPARSSDVTRANTLLRRRRDGQPVSSYSGASSTTLCPAALNSGETTSPALARRHRKGDERGRNVDVLEGAAHGVLAADGGDAQILLRLERAEKRGKRLTPARGIMPGL